ARGHAAGEHRSAHAAGPGAAAESAGPGRGDPAEEPPRLTPLSRLRAGRAIVRAACDVVAILGVAALALQLALDELPAILTHTVALVAPGFELGVGTARLEFGRLDLRDVQIRAHGEPTPLLRAARAVVRLSPWDLRLGRIDEVRLAEPVISLPATVSELFHAGHERRGRSTWSIGRLATASGQFSLVPSAEHPGLSFGFVLDLHELGLDPERAERIHHIALRA